MYMISLTHHPKIDTAAHSAARHRAVRFPFLPGWGHSRWLIVLGGASVVEGGGAREGPGVSGGTAVSNRGVTCICIYMYMYTYMSRHIVYNMYTAHLSSS